MIFRLSQKLTARIKAGAMSAEPLSENPFADWSAHLFVADRVQYVLVTNTKSLYSTVMYARGITDDNRFITQSLSSLREFIEADGQASLYRQFIVPARGTVCFAKALDRRVTGSMNDLISMATFHMIEGEMSPFDVGFKLNETPFSVLQYGNPREAFKAMGMTPRT